MKRLLGLVLLVGCVAPSIELAPAIEDREIRVESWDPALRFYFDPLRSLRATHAADSIAETPDDVDVLCVHEVTFAADREAILARAGKRWPFVGFVRTDASTPIEDPRDLTGAPRQVDLSPACTSAEDLAKVEAMVKCVQDVCVDAASVMDPGCAAEKCPILDPARPELTPRAPRCRVCLENRVGSGPLDEVRAACATRPRGELMHDGQLAAILLSRFPLEDVQAHLFPSTVTARGALSAKVMAPRPFTLVCNAILGWVSRGEYSGVFAPNTANGWSLEGTLIHLRSVELARKLAASMPTVVVGGTEQLWRTQKGVTTTSPSWDLWRANLIPLVWPEPSPPCNGCFKDNPVSAAARYKANWVEWSELLFAEGAVFGDPAMKLTRTDARVPLDGKLVPVSPYYGASVRVAWIAK